jgi:hypothetical protein
LIQAQRAIRLRTKSQIDELNQKISELENSNHIQERQAAIAQRESVQNENKDLKMKMEQVVALLQPIVGINSRSIDGGPLHECVVLAHTDCQI